jgi:hypothetical protein
MKGGQILKLKEKLKNKLRNKKISLKELKISFYLIKFLFLLKT